MIFNKPCDSCKTYKTIQKREREREERESIIFISLAAPARPIKLPRRERERERERVDDIYKHCGTCKAYKITQKREREREFFTFAILMTRFVFITSVIKNPLQVNMHNNNNNNTKT